MPSLRAGLVALTSSVTMINASKLATGGPADMAQSVLPITGKPHHDASKKSLTLN